MTKIQADLRDDPAAADDSPAWSVSVGHDKYGSELIYFEYHGHTVGRFTGSLYNAEQMVTFINAGLAALDSIVIPRSMLPKVFKDEEGCNMVDVRDMEPTNFLGKLHFIRHHPPFNQDPESEYAKALAHLAFAEYYATEPEEQS